MKTFVFEVVVLVSIEAESEEAATALVEDTSDTRLLEVATPVPA